MATISKTGIVDGQVLYADHVTRIIDALDGTAAATIVGTGSFTGSFKGDFDGQVTSASFASTASYYSGSVVSASYAVTSSYSNNSTFAINSSFATTASFITLARSASYVANAQTASFVITAQTASFVITAQTASFVTLAQTSSLALRASGSLTGSLLGTATSASYAVTASHLLGSITSASYAITSSNASTASFVILAQTASFVTTAQTASFVTLAQTASLALRASGSLTGSLLGTASFAMNASTASFVRVINDTTSATPLYLTAINSNNGSNEPEQLTNIALYYTPDTNALNLGGASVSAGIFSSINTTAVSFVGSASYAMRAQTASFVTTAATASFVTLAQTASFITTAQTASYVTSSRVFGPNGANSILSSSYAVSASWAPSVAGGTVWYTITTNSYTIPSGLDVGVICNHAGGGSAIVFFLSGTAVVGSRVEIVLGPNATAITRVDTIAPNQLQLGTTIAAAGGSISNTGAKGSVWRLICVGTNRWSLVGYSDNDTISGAASGWGLTVNAT